MSYCRNPVELLSIVIELLSMDGQRSAYSHEAAHATPNVPADHLLNPAPEELEGSIIRELIRREDIPCLVG